MTATSAVAQLLLPTQERRIITVGARAVEHGVLRRTFTAESTHSRGLSVLPADPLVPLLDILSVNLVCIFESIDMSSKNTLQILYDQLSVLS